MKLETIETVIENSKGGRFNKISWTKELKTKKNCEHKITKESFAVIRLGVNYDHKGAVIKKRENGELPDVNQGLPWGIWKLFPYIIEHKENYYLRVTTAENTKVHTRYFIDGQKALKSDISDFCLKSELPDTKEDVDVFNLKIENIKSITSGKITYIK